MHPHAQSPNLHRLADEERDGTTRVVILGAGFGGISTATTLNGRLGKNSNIEILVVNRTNALYFTPLLWTVADGRTTANDVAIPIRAFLRSRRFQVLHAEVQSIDLGQQVVVTSAGAYTYDILVVALGSTTALPGIAGLRENALLFRTPVDALQLRNRVIGAIEAAQHCDDPAERRARLTFVVAGGGDTGVELAATIRDYVDTALAPSFPLLQSDTVRVVLVERMDRLMPMGSTGISQRVRDTLAERNIEVMTGTSVESVTATEVQTSHGDIPTHTVFWAAGIAASDVVKSLDTEHAPNGAVLVDEQLKLPGYSKVFVIGDSAWAYTSSGHEPIPPTAQAAEAQGKYVARAIAQSLSGGKIEPFQFSSRGHLTLLGRHTGLAQLGSFVFTGFPAWLLWHAYYLSHIPSWRNRVRLGTSLILSGILGRETVQLPLAPDEGRANR